MNTLMGKSETNIMDIGDVIMRLLNQWKAIAIAVILMALICGGFKYHKDMQAYEAAKAAEQSVSVQDMESISEDELLSSLGSTEKAMIINYVQQLQWLRNEEEYARKSLLMRTDPNRQRGMYLTYRISSSAEAFNYNDFENAMSAYMMSTEFALAIRPSIDDTAAPGYITELVGAGFDYIKKEAPADSGTNIFKVLIVIPEKADPAALADAATAAISEYAGQKKDALRIDSIHLVNSNETRFANNYAIDTKLKANNAIRDAYNTVNNLKSSLNERQLGIAEALLTQSAMDTGEIIDEQSSEKEAEEAAAETPKPGFSKKYALGGGMLGLLLYLMVFFLNLLARGEVGSYSNAKSIAGSVRIVGTLTDGGRKKNPLLNSKLVSGLLSRKALPEEEQLEGIADSISSMCRYLDSDKVSMVCLKDNQATSLNAVKERLAGKGISADIRSLLNASGRIDEMTLSDISNGILIIREGEKQAIWKEIMNLSDRYDKDYIGAVYING